MQQLEQDFLANGGEFRDVLIGEYFTKLNLKFRKKTFKKEKDISKDKNEEFNLPLVNAKFGDNGIMYYGRNCDFDSAEMTLDIVNDGAVSTGSVYPQPQKTGVLYNAYLVKPNFPANKKLLFFMASVVEKSIKLKFGYENKAGWEKIKNECFNLPFIDNKPAFSYMENYISALQFERLSALQGYLRQEGFWDLSDEDAWSAINPMGGGISIKSITYKHSPSVYAH